MFSTLFSISTLLATALVPTALAAPDLSSANNVTSIEGTWSSGSGGVSTGDGFCNPNNNSFTYPTTTGISYSFTDTGFFEEAQYRFTANASNPNCITAYVLWQHGTYKLHDNGSLVVYPWAADGRIQVQDPCAAVTNIMTYYDQQVLYADWGIVLDTQKENYALNLNKFDGSKMPPLYRTYLPPNMLPTTVLTGVNATGQESSRKRDQLPDLPIFAARKRSDAGSRHTVELLGVLGAGLSAAVIGAWGLM